MNDKMSRYNKQMGARKFPYENLQLGVANLWVSLRETMGFLTRNWWFPYEKPEASNWGKSFSQLGAYFQRTYVHWLTNLCSSAHEPMFMGKGTYVLRNMLLVVMMLMGVNVWGQVTEGLYYIASGGNTGSGNTTYISNSPATNYYLCPTENWYYYQSDSPYYLKHTDSPNNDNGMPFMTTYQCLKLNNNYDSTKALWCIKKKENTDYYYIIHVVTGKYLTYNDAYFSNKGRVRVHLEDYSSAKDVYALFKIEYVSQFSSYDIISKYAEDNNTYLDNNRPRKYLNVNKGNKQFLVGTDADKTTPAYSGGIIGFWTYGAYYEQDNSKNDINSRWHPENTLLTAPTINYDSEANTFTISYAQIPVGFDILYTTDNSDPTIGGSTTTTVSAPAGGSTDAITVTGSYNVKAVIARYGVILTETASRFVGAPDAPTITPPSDCNNLVTMDAGGAPIYYTLDGSAPDNTSTLYTEPFVQNTAATIKAIVCVEGVYSDVTTYSYTPPYSAIPTITINGYDVTITGEGTIYYTLDGNDPTTGSSVYSTPISLSSANDAVTIKAVAKDGDKELSCVAEQTFVPATPGYYAIHQNGKGYLRVNSANVTLTNDGNFRYADLFSDDGNSIWYVTPNGYLQNGYFYLNVINGRTLCLSVEPETRWQTEEIAGDTHDKMHLKTGGLYLCNDNNTITLSASPSAYYNACPITITEKSWSGPSASDLTLQSPQQVTYLRAYYTQKMDYEFYNDAGTKVSEKGKDRRVYAKLYYESGGSNKGTNWDINTTSGVIYNKLTSNVTVTATYRIEPADPIAFGLHSTPDTKSIKYTLQPKSITPVAEMNYLLFSIKAGDNDRYPYDDGIAEGGDVKPDGKGGIGASSVLTDPDNPNLQISWKLTVDEEGFYTFQNASTNKYLYYDETPHASSDYGALKLGSSPSDNRYKFRLYKTSNTDYEVCYQIIPYSRQFAVYNNNGVATGFYTSLNNNNYKSQTPKVISLYKADDNSQWCIYKYEAEYRIRSDFSISGPNTASETGNYELTSEGWYGKYIKESPKIGKGQNGLVINGTYKDANNIDYLWTVTGLGNNITIADGTNTDGTWKKTTRGNTNNRKLVVNVLSLPTSSTSGVIQLQLFSATNDNQKWSGFKTMAFTILGNGTVEWTDITSLASITNSSGAYRLTANVTGTPGVTTFSGILDGGGHTISGLTAPLFETLTNGTVRNVNLSGVNISGNSGPTGAIAGTANGGSRIYNVGILDGSVGSSGNVCGGLVGQLDGSARVINCFSYATVTGGTKVGGIVGENKYKTTAADARTMVMNCMFYGNITGGNNKAPIYNGEIISNVGNTGVGNYNYFLADASFTNGIDTYNCALMAEKRFLQRFEFYRHLLNGHRELAGWWATGTFSKNEMAKWVMEPSQIGSDTPYPILKDQGKYPSVVNIDAENATTQSERNKGGKLGELTVNIQSGSGAVYAAPAGATITTSQLTLNITDKDPDHFNFNYYKVQLPYYNDVGTKNYTGNRVMTGWKIVSISGGTTSFTTGSDATASVDAETGEVTLTTPYNFADRNCINKDLYSVSGRVFNQGAYWDVPEGVTSITIEPYWAKCVYLADANADVVYNSNMGTAYSVPNVGGGKIFNNGTSYSIAGENQVVYTTMSNAIASSGTALFQGVDANSHSVYDYAVVLVGNYHNYNSIESSNSKPYTVTSVDLDGDNEPDYSYILRFDQRKGVHPVKYDFLNLIGLGMAQKSTGSTGSYNFGIMQPMSWFEVTNTALFRVTQLEYEHQNRVAMPLILHGGVIEQWVSGQSGGNGQQTTYIHVGSNVWFKEFHLGCHQDATLVTKHPPVSVTGGDYNEFYLTGLYSAAANCEDNAECYINGGRFGKVAGTGIEGIGKANGADNTGNIVWQIQNADIDEFYGGGINAAKPMQGNITTVITGSHVKRFCGGPKFGDMNTGKTVITTATNCTFGSFFGAGYGGNSYNRAAPGNFTGSANYRWNDWIAGTVHGSINNGNYPGGVTYSGYKQDYISNFGGVSTRFDYQFLPQSDNVNNVGRLFIDFVNFSLATTHNVTSTLTGCTITGNFYGGGSLGKVAGDVTSTLTNCTVHGSVFGGGYDATRPTVQVMSTAGFTTPPSYNTNTGVFIPAAEPYNISEEYTWSHRETVNSTETAINKTDHILYTTADLNTLGQVTGNVTLDISGNTLVEGQAVDYEGNPTGGDRGGVFGGGDASAVLGNTTVTINATAQQEGATYNAYRVYGGGNSAPVGGNSTVTLRGKTQVLDNVFGGGNEGLVEGSATVNIEQ